MSDAASAEAVIDAVLRGTSLAVWVSLDADAAAAFHDELGRVAELRSASDDGDVQATGPDLDDIQVALLDLLVEGRTLGDAARSLGLSRRSADRRMSSVRRVLGVETTAEAIVSWSKRGRPT